MFVALICRRFLRW